MKSFLATFIDIWQLFTGHTVENKRGREQQKVNAEGPLTNFANFCTFVKVFRQKLSDTNWGQIESNILTTQKKNPSNNL